MTLLLHTDLERVNVLRLFLLFVEGRGCLIVDSLFELDWQLLLQLVADVEHHFFRVLFGCHLDVFRLDRQDGLDGSSGVFQV